MNKLQTLAVLSIAVVALSACASSPPTLGERAEIQGKQFKTVAKRWDKGQELIRDGNKDIEKGEKLIKKGRKLVNSGERDVARGKSMVKDSESKYDALNQ